MLRWLHVGEPVIPKRPRRRRQVAHRLGHFGVRHGADLRFASCGARPTWREVNRARALCEKLLSYASPLLLYAEEIDPHTGRQLGNIPQAFSHLALINALVHLIREDERLGATTAITSDLDPEPLARTPG